VSRCWLVSGRRSADADVPHVQHPGRQKPAVDHAPTRESEKDVPFVQVGTPEEPTVMLHEARNVRRPPALARVMLGLGVAANVAVNVAYGASYGAAGAVISAWTAVAFIGSAELLMAIIRRTQPAHAQVPEPAPVPGGVPGTDALRVRASEVFAADLAAGRTPSIRAIRAHLLLAARVPLTLCRVA
jgi:hypothetical protein